MVGFFIFTQHHERRPRTIRNHFIATTLISLALVVGGSPAVAAKHHQAHAKGCNTHACDVRVGRKWAIAHKPPFRFTYLIRCVANREAGEPGSTSLGLINWHLHDQSHTGGLQYDHTTWEEAGGLKYAYEAYEATPEEQAKTFYDFYPGHESRWGETAPDC
jgi:hypothetical protein